MTGQPTGREPGRQTQTLLVYLSQLPRTGVFLGALAIVLAGLFAPGIIGAAILTLIGAGLIALLTLTWPHLPPARRTMQLLVLVVLAVAVVGKILF